MTDWFIHKPTIWERIRMFFSRERCDGCNGNFRIDKTIPVSGDCYLCDKCFEEWYDT